MSSQTIKVVSYNIHSCRGLDRRYSPERVGRILRRINADIIALQEVDLGKARSAYQNQASIIAGMLGMDYLYHATVEICQEQYGLAVLSHLPMSLVRADAYDPAPDAEHREPRGAMVVNVQAGNKCMHFVNTHFGLTRRERVWQARSLVDEVWLADLHHEPLILCGDFNTRPGSPVFDILQRHMDDVYTRLGHRPPATFPSMIPVWKLDHILVNREVRVRSAHRFWSWVGGIASDHIPVIADLAFSQPDSEKTP